MLRLSVFRIVMRPQKFISTKKYTISINLYCLPVIFKEHFLEKKLERKHIIHFMGLF